MSGQAGDTEEIEITPAMIEAGALALEAELFKQDYSAPLGPYTREAIARTVFKAMIAIASH